LAPPGALNNAMRITIVTPPFARDRFSGGIWCVMQHAQQLALRGHEVSVVPSHPCPLPAWLPRPWHFRLVSETPAKAARAGLAGITRALATGARLWLNRGRPPDAASQADTGRVREGAGRLGIALSNFSSYGVRQGGAIDHLARVLPAADLTLATDSETAWPVRLLGQGRLACFAQHYEPYFWKERLGGEASRRESELAYGPGLDLLANSPWLQQRLQATHPGRPVQLCPNAIDHRIFSGMPTVRTAGEPLRIISYGGRDAEWKGLREICEALRRLKAQHPALAFEWSVYGNALLPPDNPVFPYRPLGFLGPAALAQAYRAHHLLLSASWYESFPLFPLEAMACGLATITTQPGTEAFAEDGRTALVVEPKNPDSIASAVHRMAGDEPLRQRIASQGRERSLEFTWERAGDAMEAALETIRRGAPTTGSAL